MRRTIAFLLCAGLLACTSGGGTGAPAPLATPTTRSGDSVVVASFNFTESSLLAEIYAQALERVGVPVRRELALGPRELVQPALVQGYVDVVPEYLGTALRTVNAAADAVDRRDPAQIHDELSAAVAPMGLRPLTPSAAQDQNGLVVTRDRADQMGLRAVSDLRDHAGTMVIGGPAECPTRPFCLLGLERVYGLQFAQFLPLADLEQEKTALEQGVIDVAVMFTTDGRLDDPGLALLDDDRHLQPAENVVPLVATRTLDRYGPRVTDALDAVSAHLTTTNLRFLNWRVDVAHSDIVSEARGWITRNLAP